MNSCNRLLFSNFYILAAQCCRLMIFQTINSVRSNSLSLKYQRFKSSGWAAIGIRKVEFVAKTQFLFPFLKKFSSKEIVHEH